jgi:beta-glucanase (GH16 family)
VQVGSTTTPLNKVLGFNTLSSSASDEFDGTAGSKPDATRWHAKTFNASNGSVVYWNGMNNVQMDGTGNLDIFAIRGSDGLRWTSTWLSGNKSYAGPHYIEARAKLPAGSGTWNCPIWEWDAPYGTQGVENDVNEQLGKEAQAYHTTLHSNGQQVSKINNTASILANDYHTYGSAVYADHVDYYLDEVKIQTITKTELGGLWGYVENPLVLNISLDMGGWGGTPSTTLPGTLHMLIDNIRVYTP